MWRLFVLAIVVSFTVLGCAAPQQRLGPPPNPVLSTRAPRTIAPIPAPEEVTPPPGPPRAGPQSLRGTTIVVDPGHGGRDPGALGRGPVPEKTINLNMGRLLADKLRQRGANVVMTRSTDRFIELDDRAALADRTRADLFVSLHADSARRESATGMSVYIRRNATAASRGVAQHIASALARAGLDALGVKTAGYRVLVAHSRPAVLIECGYVSNRAEASRLANNGYEDRLTEAIAEGIVAYFAR